MSLSHLLITEVELDNKLWLRKQVVATTKAIKFITWIRLVTRRSTQIQIRKWLITKTTTSDMMYANALQSDQQQHSDAFKCLQ